MLSSRTRQNLIRDTDTTVLDRGIFSNDQNDPKHMRHLRKLYIDKKRGKAVPSSSTMHRSSYNEVNVHSTGNNQFGNLMLAYFK